MPLAPGNSPDVISRNISELTHHGSHPRSHAQIVAIALSNADRHPGHASGGSVDLSYSMPSDTNSPLRRPPLASSPSRHTQTPVETPFEVRGDIGKGYGPIPPVTAEFTHSTPFADGGVIPAGRPPDDNSTRMFDSMRFWAGPPRPDYPSQQQINDDAKKRLDADDALARRWIDQLPHRAAGGIAPFHLMPALHAMPHVAQPMSPGVGTPWWSRTEARGMGHGFAEGGGLGAAGGGMIPSSESSPWTERQDARIADTPFHGGGFLGGSGAGRTDRLPLAVGAESHVLPADTMSGVGQGSSKFGANAIMASLSTGPWGVPVPRAMHASTIPHPPSVPHSETGLAQGGAPHGASSILAADGELVVPPDIVEALGHRGIEGGMGKKGETAIECGHRLLDEMIHRVRTFQIDWLKSAPDPKK